MPTRHLKPILWGSAVLLGLAAASLAILLPDSRQEEAIREIERMGGIVIRDPGGPAWLREFAGRRATRFFDSVYLVNLQDTPLADADLALLNEMDGPQRLNLRNTSVGDDGLKHLPAVTTLRALDLSENPVTDAGLAHLKNLRNLEYLYLADTRVTDAGLKELRGLEHFRHLDVSGTEVTPAGAKRLRKTRPRLTIVPFAAGERSTTGSRDAADR